MTKTINISIADQFFKDALFFLINLKKNKIDGLNEKIILENILKYVKAFAYYNNKGKTAQLKLGITINGQKEEINLFKDSRIVFERFFEELKKVISQIGLEFYFKNIEKEFKSLNFNHKIAIINAENTFLINEIKNFIYSIEDTVFIDAFIEERLNLIFDLIYDFEEKQKKYPDFLKDADKNILYNVLNFYLGLKIDFFIFSNRIFQIYYYLKDEINLNDDERIIKILIEKIIYLNNSFLIESKNDIVETIDNLKGIIKDEELEELNEFLLTNPKSIQIGAFKTNHGNLTETDLKTKSIYTIIKFSLPGKAKEYSNKFELTDSCLIHYEKIRNKLNDPIYKLYKDFSIGGMGWNYFTDTYHSLSNENLFINFVIKKPFHPDFEIKEDKIVDINYKEKEILIGRDYYPHKEFVVKTLYRNYDKFSSEISIEKKDININLFSTFIVDYIDSFNNSLLLRRLYAITNPDTYQNVSNKFIERLNELNLSDQYIPIRDLCEKAQIFSDKTLSSFIESLLNIVLKNNVELHGNYKYFWTDDSKPKSEPNMQPLIMAQLKAICDFMGIQISREVESANGEIDFLCSYTYQNKILKTCVEVKNAHSNKIESGLEKQLPEYLKSERTKNGIYLVLWYKGKLFGKPEKYQKIDDLLFHLNSLKPTNFLIRLIVINCNKPISPSML
ncbi:MAG: hypothetical protein KDC74_03905 [Flavobacteriaceae bacterium]|nr:hypothetical protein [Flavobacteriaceae bacterium]